MLLLQLLGLNSRLDAVNPAAPREEFHRYGSQMESKYFALQKLSLLRSLLLLLEMLHRSNRFEATNYFPDLIN